jgi:diguanylate cyclase (GGDEF)-like protein/PAS domain S-box-containing protein
MVDIVFRVSRLGVVLEEHGDSVPPALSAGIDTLVGRRLAEAVGAADPASIDEVIARAIDTGEPVVREWRSVRSDCGYWEGSFVRGGADDAVVVLRDSTRERCRADADALMGELAQQVMDTRASPTGDDVRAVLQHAAEFVGAAQASVVVVDRRTSLAIEEIHWSPDIEPVPYEPAAPGRPAWLSSHPDLIQRPTIFDAAEIPPEAVTLRSVMERHGLAAVSFIALIREASTFGVISFGFRTRPDRVTRLRHDALGELGHLVSGIVERTRRATQERESRLRLASLVEHSRDLIAVLAVDGAIKYLSPSIAAMGAMEPGSRRAGVHPIGNIAREYRADIADSFARALERPGEPVPVRFGAHGPGDRMHHIVGTLTNLLEVAGVEGVVLNARDVTDEEIVAAELERRAELDFLGSEISRRLLSVPSESMVDALRDALGRVARHLGADASTLGRRDDDGWFSRVCSWYEPEIGPVPGSTIDRVPPEAFPWAFAAVESGQAGVVRHIDELPPEATAERARMEQIGARAAALVSVPGGGAVLAYVNFYWRAGEPDERAAMAAPLRGIAEMLTAAHDRAMADLGRAEADERLQSVFDTLGEGIAVTDREGTIVSVNPAAAAVFGQSIDELVGLRGWWRLIAPVAEDGARIEVRDLPTVATLADGKSRDNVRVGIATRRGRRWFSVNTRAVGFDADGRPSGVVTSFVDVTARVESEELKGRLAAIVESSVDAIVSTDPDGIVLSWNAGAERLFGWSADEIVGRSAAVLNPSGWEDERDSITAAITRGELLEEYETVRQAKDGSLLDVAVSVSATRDAQGRVVGASGITRDITAQKQNEEDRRRAEARFRSLIEHGSEGILVVDRDGVIMFASPAVASIYGQTAEELVGAQSADLVPMDTRDEARRTYEELLSTPGTVVTFEDYVLHRDGQRRWVEGTTTNLLHEESVQGFVVNVRDVSERKMFEQELEHQALHDALTGLPNRALLVDRLEQALARARRSPHAVGLLFLDLDRFKYVNDSRGHASGDELLRIVGERLRRAMRASDTVARFGGDEFVVLVEESASTDGLLAAVEQLRTALRSPFVLDGVETFITASIGIASSQPGREDPDELIRDADAAMYRAKDRGRDRYEMFDPSIHARAVEHLEITNALRAAVVEDQLRLHYQPIVEMTTGKVRGFEALLRWHQPDGTVSLPDNLIAIAEETGLIVPIGAWVVEETCRQLAVWAHIADTEPPGVGMNLSVRQLRERAFVEDVAQVAARHGVSPKALTFEITESVLADDAASTLDTLNGLRDLGIRLVVDDFGTGYSSLAYLKRLPVMAVKIDRTFTDGLGDNAEDTAIVTAITGLARGLDLAVVAEGVESRWQVDQLLALGVEVGQGFYFGHPAPADHWTDLVEQADPTVIPSPAD